MEEKQDLEQEHEKMQLDNNLCEECKSNPSKYKCPGCSIRTCSLTCVNSQKKRTSCTGKRPLTGFVSISQFDDNQLLSDYYLLEDVKRIAESAQRKRIKLCGNSRFKLPLHLKGLQNAAAKRRTKLILLSKGMSKSERNKTCYNHRKKSISWTIEWRFHTSEVVIVEHGVHEDSTISSVIQKHLEPGPWNHPLKKFREWGLESLTFCIHKYPKDSKSPFIQLDVNKPIREQLAGRVILEYPIIYIFTPLHKNDYEVINVTTPNKMEIRVHARQDSPSPKGVTFRVEEIEDEPSSDPHSSDLLNFALDKTEPKNESKDMLQSPLVVSKGTKQETSVSDSEPRGTAIEDSDLYSFYTLDELSDIPEFDFEPGSLDMYSELIMDNNEDDFFGFDGPLIDMPKNVPKNLCDRNVPIEEELEEGEIA